jgi:hypothetical protein
MSFLGHLTCGLEVCEFLLRLVHALLGVFEALFRSRLELGSEGEPLGRGEALFREHHHVLTTGDVTLQDLTHTVTVELFEV